VTRYTLGFSHLHSYSSFPAITVLQMIASRSESR
jgi:hypothetical protein